MREIVPRFKIVPRGTIEASVTGVDGICEELWMTVQVETAWLLTMDGARPFTGLRNLPQDLCE